MVNYHKDAQAKIPFGCFSRTTLDRYRKRKKLSAVDIKMLGSPDDLTKAKLESCLGQPVDARSFYLIKEFGLALGAFLIPTFDWELVAVATGNTNYMNPLIELAENEKLFEMLDEQESCSLKLLANAYRVTLSLQNNQSHKP